MRVRGGYTRLNKLKAARLLLKDNGLQWSTYFVASYVLENTVDLLHNRMRALERCHNLPGSNSVGLNYEKWQSWGKDGQFNLRHHGPARRDDHGF